MGGGAAAGLHTVGSVLQEIAGFGKARLHPSRRQTMLESDPRDLLARKHDIGTRQGKHTARSLTAGKPEWRLDVPGAFPRHRDDMNIESAGRRLDVSTGVLDAPLLGFHNTATRERPGTASLSSSSRFASSSTAIVKVPVTLPPGRARLEAIPSLTGSSSDSDRGRWERCPWPA